MKRMQDVMGHKQEWIQPRAMKRDFELRDGEEIVATLEFRSAFGSLATAETAEGSWTFKRVGFWKTRVTICESGSEAEIATFKNSTWSSGGTLELGDRPPLRADTNFWMSKYQFT